VSWSVPLSWSLSSLLEPYSALLWPPLDFSQHRAFLRHWPKIHSPALSSLDCSQLNNRRLIGCPLPLLVAKCFCCLLGNRMVRFGILDCLVLLSQSSSALLMADMSIAAIPYIIASMAKTVHWS
jgi:hypothetical protein